MLVIDLVTDDPDNKFAPYQQMANAIIKLTNKNGKCEPQDLLSLGFSKEETNEHWHMASAMANVELKLMKDEDLNIAGRNKLHLPSMAALQSFLRFQRP